jgi:hypothetical protein
MKTTIEIADALLEQARTVAAAEGRTLRALVEEALRQTLAQRAARERFTLRRATFGGEGLQPEWRGRDWEAVRQAAYEGRGG